MALQVDLRRIADDVPWQNVSWQADLQRLTDSTAAAAKAFATDCETLSQLANMVPRARCDTVGASPWNSFRTEIAIAKDLTDR